MCDQKSCPSCCAKPATEQICCPDHRMVERRHTDCTVEVLRCETCGHISVAWWPNDQPPMIVLSPDQPE